MSIKNTYRCPYCDHDITDFVRLNISKMTNYRKKTNIISKDETERRRERARKMFAAIPLETHREYMARAIKKSIEVRKMKKINSNPMDIFTSSARKSSVIKRAEILMSIKNNIGVGSLTEKQKSGNKYRYYKNTDISDTDFSRSFIWVHMHNKNNNYTKNISSFDDIKKELVEFKCTIHGDVYAHHDQELNIISIYVSPKGITKPMLSIADVFNATVEEAGFTKKIDII